MICPLCDDEGSILVQQPSGLILPEACPNCVSEPPPLDEDDELIPIIVKFVVRRSALERGGPIEIVSQAYLDLTGEDDEDDDSEPLGPA